MPLGLGIRFFFLGMDFALPAFSISSFLLANFCLKYESEVACLVSHLLQHFFADIFASGFGIIILKTLVFTASVFAWVSMDDPVTFKSEVDWRTGGPEGLWLLDGIL
jgi:hypothetical protein